MEAAAAATATTAAAKPGAAARRAVAGTAVVVGNPSFLGWSVTARCPVGEDAVEAMRKRIIAGPMESGGATAVWGPNLGEPGVKQAGGAAGTSCTGVGEEDTEISLVAALTNSPRGRQGLREGVPSWRAHIAEKLQPGMIVKHHLSQLPGAEAESAQVAALLEGAGFAEADGRLVLLRGEEATKAKVVALLEQREQGGGHCEVLHLATHGAPDGLFLAGATADDAKLSMSEVQQLSLPTPLQLVVLSECNSLRGEVHSDGVVGITRSFVAAGALNLVASLWSVDDQATRTLMDRFYSEYLHLRYGAGGINDGGAVGGGTEEAASLAGGTVGGKAGEAGEAGAAGGGGSSDGHVTALSLQAAIRSMISDQRRHSAQDQDLASMHSKVEQDRVGMIQEQSEGQAHALAFQAKVAQFNDEGAEIRAEIARLRAPFVPPPDADHETVQTLVAARNTEMEALEAKLAHHTQLQSELEVNQVALAKEHAAVEEHGKAFVQERDALSEQYAHPVQGFTVQQWAAFVTYGIGS